METRIRRAKSTINDLKMFYKTREKVITLFDDYTTIVSKAKYEAKHGKWLKILTPKQMFQRLPIALAQLKASNTSEDLLNQFRQIIYYLYQAKKPLKRHIII